MYNTARLVLAFVKSAVSRGAVAANYTEATGFLWDKARVCGARVRDRISGEEFDIRAKLVLNAAGPWADYLLEEGERFRRASARPFLARRLLHRESQAAIALCARRSRTRAATAMRW